MSLGHLVVEVSRGRGKANFYRALLKEPAQPSTGAEVATDAHEVRPIRTEAGNGELEKRTPVSAYENENRTNEAVKPDNRVRPTLLEPYYPPPFPPSGASSQAPSEAANIRSPHHEPHPALRQDNRPERFRALARIGR